jgi:hypothetical protein
MRGLTVRPKRRPYLLPRRPGIPRSRHFDTRKTLRHQRNLHRRDGPLELRRSLSSEFCDKPNHCALGLLRLRR